MDWIRWFHLLAAAVWTGGLIVLATSVVALRRAGAEREHLQAAARMFARVSWAAMTVSVITGIAQLLRMGLVSMSIRSAFGRALFLKLTLVGLAAALALAHQLTAARTSARVRGMIQGVILLLSLGIFAAAVRL